MKKCSKMCNQHEDLKGRMSCELRKIISNTVVSYHDIKNSSIVSFSNFLQAVSTRLLQVQNSSCMIDIDIVIVMIYHKTWEGEYIEVLYNDWVEDSISNVTCKKVWCWVGWEVKQLWWRANVLNAWNSDNLTLWTYLIPNFPFSKFLCVSYKEVSAILKTKVVWLILNADCSPEELWFNDLFSDHVDQEWIQKVTDLKIDHNHRNYIGSVILIQIIPKEDSFIRLCSFWTHHGALVWLISFFNEFQT